MPGDTPGAACFTIHVSESPEQRLEQMQSVEQIPSPGCITAGGREQPLCPPPPQPQQALGIQRHELPGPARSRHKHPPSKQDAFPHGANISGTTGNVQLDYNALRKGHGEISALYLELCLFSAG